MRTSKVWVIGLGLAGILECGMAMAHFGLQWEWRDVSDFGGLPNQLQWALFTLNFSWGVLLLGIGGLVLYAATLKSDGAFLRRSMFVIGLFWAIHGAYIWLEPMPLPDRLLWLRLPMAVFPATLVFLHWAALAGTVTENRAAVAAA